MLKRKLSLNRSTPSLSVERKNEQEEVMRKNRKGRHIPLAYRAEEAFKKAVAEALAEHRLHGVPIAIWRNGRVVRIPADQIEVREPQIEYTVSSKKRK